MRYRHLFGPVNSRRLGFSLGVDVVPYKYCPLNCVYCEVQRTTHLTLRREEFFPPEEIIAELTDFLSSAPALDYITFSGTGEPTLYSAIGRIVSFIKASFPQYKLALLTNGVLLNDPELRKEILPCDLILPSLDACHQNVYKRINRPHQELKVANLIRGLAALRHEYDGAIWLEVFIIAGINDTEAELNCLVKAISKIKPDRVQINSLDRPGAEDWVKPAGVRVLGHVQRYLQERTPFPVEIIAKVHTEAAELEIPEDIEQGMAATLARRPCTAEDLAQIMGIHINEVSKILRQLHSEDKVRVKREARGVFYSWNH